MIRPVQNKDLQVTHLSTSEQSGGAARAANRLHRALIDTDTGSSMVVCRKNSDDDTVIEVSLPARIRARVQSKVERLLTRGNRSAYDPSGYPVRLPDPPFSLNWPVPLSGRWLSSSVARELKSMEPDVVHLHWINGGGFPLSDIGSLERPVVWTCHDMWPFTGGCHYAWDCDRYTSECETCPQLDGRTKDLSHRTWHRKRRIFESLDLTVVTPSTWLAERARESSLFTDVSVEVIPYCIDCETFTARERTASRKRFGFETDSFIIGHGAAYETPRKGYDSFKEALGQLDIAEFDSPVTVATFGADDNKMINGPFETKNVGYLDDEALIQFYSALDVTVAPSLVDNLPLIIMESLACGTPVVGFEIGGIEDMVDHEETGYLASPFDVSEIATGIRWVDEQDASEIQAAAQRRIRERYSQQSVTAQYIDLYDRLSPSTTDTRD